MMAKCKECGGSGEVDCGVWVRACEHCDGTGVEPIKCPECLGKRIIIDRSTLPNSHVKCTACDGSGKKQEV